MVLQKSSLSSMDFKVRRNPAELVPPAEPTPHELKLGDSGKEQRTNSWWIAQVKVYCSLKLMQMSHLTSLVLILCLHSLASMSSSVMFHFLMMELLTLPLLLIQVTRLKCGGFIFGIPVNHVMCDGIGIAQFIKAVAEIAQSAPKPSIMPVWCRDHLCARDPPTVTCLHLEYQQQPLHDNKTLSFKSSHASFFFGPKHIHALRNLLPPHLAQSSSTFDILTAFLWRCHTAALHWQNPNQEIRFTFNRPLPEGYYGNAFVMPAVVSTVEMLCDRPLSYALELAKKSKKGSFIVSDLTKSRLSDVDFGWGKPLYSGVNKDGIGDNPGVSYYIPYTNSKGEHGKVVLICLPDEAMKRFHKELNVILLHINDEDEPIM
ncbi:hypothetical protein PIB30_007020 [Stylosanthes scabra]|uniref:Uncharacterized protein n=1 Tax=Stylosanthes scabra TaxID=79078 RepID=A0ABU6Z560_9FABA|nr:hypothetical protein [Stylosanthes scabra]